MEESTQTLSIFNYRIRPFSLAGGSLTLTILFLSINYMFYIGGIKENYTSTYWVISGSFTLLFSILCSVMSLAYNDQNKYLLEAILAYIVLAVCGGVLAYLFSGETMDEAGTFRWLYVVFTFTFFIFMGIARFIRRLVIISEKHDEKFHNKNKNKNKK